MSWSHLDEVDLKILEHLVTDARLSQRALARSIGMSPPAISERISRLEASGVIRGYRAIVDWSALRRPMLVDISVLSERSADQREVAARLLEIPEVESVDIITGSLDLRLRLRIADLDHLREVFFDELLAVSGIQHTNTSIVLSTLEPPNFARSVLQELLSQVAEEDVAGR
ncbi:MAG TPA: Lrp/AsnC family transcriptional regulator [Acidimicrobiales bacterium]|nr:Lrp/AsnC family transcriptional regulator [Acidimicrobiales bacterium]